jgi:hypothetical protein
MDRVLPGERLPAQHGDVHIGRIQFNGMAGAASHLGGDDRGPRTGKRLVNRLAGCGVILDRATHALNGLLSAVASLGVKVLDIPDGRLLAAALPLARLAVEHCIGGNLVLRDKPPVIRGRTVAHRIGQRLILPIIVAPPDHRPRLHPNYCRPYSEPTGNQAFKYLSR